MVIVAKHEQTDHAEISFDNTWYVIFDDPERVPCEREVIMLRLFLPASTNNAVIERDTDDLTKEELVLDHIHEFVIQGRANHILDALHDNCTSWARKLRPGKHARPVVWQGYRPQPVCGGWGVFVSLLGVRESV